MRITALNEDTATSNGDNLATYIDDTLYPYDDNIIAVSDPNNPNFDPRETDLWPTPLNTHLRGGINGGNVISNDEIEYTTYYLSSGDTTASNVIFCDYIPESTSFIANVFNDRASQNPSNMAAINFGIELLRNGTLEYHTGADDGDRATYFAPSINPATRFPDISCDGDSDDINTNTNGAIVVNLGNLTNASAATQIETESYGYVRFRVQVN